ncbi:VacJ family lipoprotein [Pseudoxanthomonas sp.]|uniref:MlaA family lipoprotein n=1 Tax=Pseudoxanthomonas sp. TaxID=1871049 RepID=UPI00258A551C|nr:VacJ family lipoprotein [Pseudoxanthomonas sp.]MCR6686155.1 VacJ family lipoprotein [Pseudoxanthomonas sp.]
MIRLAAGPVLASLLLAGCASTPKPGATPPPAAIEVAAPAAVQPGDGQTASLDAGTTPAAAAAGDAAAADAMGTTQEATTAAAVPASDAATAAEDDFAALYGEPADAAAPGQASADGARPAYDPWEPMNRRIHAFNNAVDRTVARPLAKAYVAVVPQPVRLGVTNFFDNLGSPLTFVNQLLQGRPRDAVQTLGRFVVNSTLGIGGVFDPASDLKMKRRSEDFGQTLGTWGWGRSRYVELPFFGPRTVRDVFGLAADAPLSPIRQIEEDKVRIGLQGVQLVDTRAQLLSLDALRDAAPDEYAMTRDAWLARRNYMIEIDRRHPAEDELPDYLREEERDPTVPAAAMPIPGG